MENVNVYSPVEDKSIKTNLNDSPIWKKAYTEEEYNENPKRYPYWWKYSMKFDGKTPKQVTKVQKLAN